MIKHIRSLGVDEQFKVTKEIRMVKLINKEAINRGKRIDDNAEGFLRKTFADKLI